MDNLNILIVEDESLEAYSLANTVTALGYNVVEYATNSALANEVIAQQNIDLILMDIHLNEPLDGIDLYKSFNSNILVIYLTAYKDDATINKAIETEPLGFLVKPHDEDELKALLKLDSHKIQNDTTSKRVNLGHYYYYHVKEEKLYHHHMHINLGKKELMLIKLLVDTNGNTLSFKTIEDEIWPDSSVTNSSVRTLLYRLRNKLHPDVIENQFNLGVRLQYLPLQRTRGQDISISKLSILNC